MKRSTFLTTLFGGILSYFLPTTRKLVRKPVHAVLQLSIGENQFASVAVLDGTDIRKLAEEAVRVAKPVIRGGAIQLRALVGGYVACIQSIDYGQCLVGRVDYVEACIGRTLKNQDRLVGVLASMTAEQKLGAERLICAVAELV